MRGRKVKVESLSEAMGLTKENLNISQDTIQAALSEGLEKAFRKHVSCPDAVVRTEVNSKGEFLAYQIKTVVEEVEDDEIEIGLDEAAELKSNAQLGDTIEFPIDITEFGRAEITLFKNVMLQKIKEATKQVVYNEFIDKVDDMVTGVVETVEEKFTLVNLGTTLALMAKSEQIPYETYKADQRIKVVIKEVNKESKGAQVIVSRSSAMLVKRLFETSVPEIYEGTVEIKGISRVANERTKMAVYSKNPNVDAIGACIGPRGQRIVSVIKEITTEGNPNSHENIDIVEWNSDLIEYVKNVFKPAVVVAVVPNDEDNTLLVVVEDNQLSLAIGRRGINVKLANQLLNKKSIDIKTVTDVEALGIDYNAEMEAYRAAQLAKHYSEPVVLAEGEETIPVLLEEEPVVEEVETVVEEVVETVEETVAEVVSEPTVEEQLPAEEPVTQPQVQEEPQPQETEEETVEVEEVAKRRKKQIKVVASDYVSKYESLADAKKEETTTVKKKKRVTKEDLEALEVKEQLEALKNKEYEIKPEYSEEELEEFNNAEDDHWYDDDVDYDEYDEYYDN